MQCFDNGCLYSVTVTKREVQEFANKWPNSDLPNRAITFQFEKRTGDLVDITPDNVDGEDALALSNEAQAYGKKRLGLEF